MYMYLPAEVLIVYVKDLAEKRGLGDELCFRPHGEILRHDLINIINSEMVKYDALELCFKDVVGCDGLFLDELVVKTIKEYWPNKNKLFFLSQLGQVTAEGLEMWLYGLAEKGEGRMSVMWYGKDLGLYYIVGPIEKKVKETFDFISSHGYVTPRDVLNEGFTTDIAGASTLLRKVFNANIVLRKRDDSEGYIQHIYYLPNAQKIFYSAKSYA